MVTPTTTDFRKISDAARQRVQRIYDDVTQQVTRPDVERRDLEEYNALTDEEHTRLYQQVGDVKYREYVDTMERLKLKQGG
jgi:hypothetical protein